VNARAIKIIQRRIENMATSNKSKCTSANCGKSKPLDKYYMSQSSLYKNNNNRFTICKDCMIKRYDELVKKYNNELKALYHLCMNFDIYYGNDLAISLQEKAENNKKDNLAKSYLKTVNSLSQYKGLTSLDSDILLLDETQAISLEKEEINNEFIVTQELLDRWGDSYSTEDIKFLEQIYIRLAKQHDARKETIQMIIEDIARAKLQAKKCIDGNNTAGYEKMTTLVSKLMSDGKLKPSQETNIGEDDTQTWGTLIAKIEKERPIGEPSEEFKNADKIMRYVTQWYTNQMQRVFGQGGVFNGNDQDKKTQK